MVQFSNAKLPESVQPYRMHLDYNAAVRKAIGKAQRAAAELWAIEDLPHIGSIEEMTPAWVQSSIGNNLKAAQGDMSLTTRERSKRVKEWRDIEQKAILLTETVQQILAEYTDIIWCYDPDNGTLSVNENDMQQAIDKRSTVDVPGAAKTHWKMLQSIIADIEKLRLWEEQQNVEPFRISDAAKITPIAFAEIWATRSNRINHRFDHYRSKNNNLIV